MPHRNKSSGILSRLLAEAVNSGFRGILVIDEIGNRIVGVGLESQGSGVVGHDENLVVVISIESFENRTKNLLVNKLNSLDFVFYFMPVSALIRGFDVDIDEVLSRSKLVYTSLSLALEVGVNIAGSTINVNDIHATELADALEKVDG